jgi:hypothetical protein
MSNEPPPPYVENVLLEKLSKYGFKKKYDDDDRRIFKENLRTKTETYVSDQNLHLDDIHTDNYDELTNIIFNLINHEYHSIDRCIEFIKNKTISQKYRSLPHLISVNGTQNYPKEKKYSDALKIIKEYNDSKILPMNISYTETEKYKIIIYFNWS